MDEYGSDDNEWDELDFYDPDEDDWKQPELTPEERKKREQFVWDHLMTDEQKQFIRELSEVFTPPPWFYEK